MLNSTEDAEDVLQEVFTASFNAMIADARAINARPWLYRIARNRCLNHLRRPTSAGQDSMDVFERDGGATTADTVHKREEFRQIVADVHDLPETQRTALLLREIDALSYDDIATAMDTTVPSVKSLLVRARVSLAEAAEARLLTCDEVRLELGHVAEGIARSSAPVRRHLKTCERCRVFKGELRRANRALAAVYPIGPFVLVKKFLAAKISFGAGASTAGGSSGGAGFAGGAAAAAGSAAGGAGAGAGGLLSAGFGTVASKAVAGFAAAAIVTAGAVEAKHVADPGPAKQPVVAAVIAPRVPFVPAPVAAPAIVHPRVVAVAPQPKTRPEPAKVAAPKPPPAPTPATPQPVPAATTPVTTTAAAPTTTTPTAHTTQPPPAQQTTQEDSSTVVLTDESSNGNSNGSSGGGSSSAPSDGSGSAQGSGPGQGSPPGESSSAPPQPQPAPVVGEPNPGPFLGNSGGAPH
jgi:RNA polymerase sigma factor (sigma-70 family)